MPRLLAVLVAAGAAAAAGCGTGGVAATVGESTITIAELQGEIVNYSESFDEPLPVTGDLADVQRDLLVRQINHLLLIELAEQEGVQITEADVDALTDQLGSTEEEIDALRAQFVLTEDGLRRAIEDQLRVEALTPIVGDIPTALAQTADEVGVEVNPRYGSWADGSLQPGTGSISSPVGS